MAMAKQAPLLLLGGFAMVLAQITTVVGVLIGTAFQSCTSSDQCEPGLFCTTGGRDRCEFCGETYPLTVQWNDACIVTTDPRQDSVKEYRRLTDPACKIYNDPWAERFAGWNTTLISSLCTTPTDQYHYARNDLLPASTVASWCETCIHPIDMSFNAVKDTDLTRGNVNAMLTFDVSAALE
jgi:hypothetical protein